MIYDERNFQNDSVNFLDFGRFISKPNPGWILIPGQVDVETIRHYSSTNKKIAYIDFEEPNRIFFLQDPNNLDYSSKENEIDKVFTLCPYTAKWMNDKQGTNKRVPVFFPMNEDLIPDSSIKKYDIVYSGGIFSGPIKSNLSRITKFNACIISYMDLDIVTHHNVTYRDKLRLISQSKVSLIHNTLSVVNDYMISQLHKVDGYAENEAFVMIPSKLNRIHYLKKRIGLNAEIQVPQLKSRVFEAAFLRSLMLVRKDSFNIIENYFKPNEDFIYYEDNNLVSRLSEIVENYESYAHIVENAYNKAINNYTTKHFFEKFLKNYC